MIQSVERAFAVLDAVGARPKIANIAAIARQVNLPRTTVNRLISTLQTIGAIERATAADHFQIGPRILSLAAQVPYTQHLITIAQPCLQELAQATSEAVYLGVPDNDHVHYVSQINSRHRIQVQDWTDTRLPMHTAAAGLVFMAGWSTEAIERYLTRPIERYTEKTVSEPALIRQRLKKIKRQGYAWSREQTELGLVGVAAPIHNQAGQVIAAVSLGGPAFRFPSAGQDEAFATQTIVAANKISQTI